MLQQELMIEKVREVCDRDDRLVSALMYGSFALGQGDRFSDIEFYLFFQDEALADLDEETWVVLYYVNEFGNGTAIFENLVRGEFHFERASERGLVGHPVPFARLGGAGG
jgi:lincosamide nucleotidyltransferase B/F